MNVDDRVANPVYHHIHRDSLKHLLRQVQYCTWDYVYSKVRDPVRDRTSIQVYSSVYDHMYDQSWKI